MTAEALRTSTPNVSGELSSKVTAAIQQWQAELLDLSKSNRLLFFKTGRGALRLTHPTSDVIYDLLANRNRALTFCRPDGPEDSEAQLELVLDGDEQDGQAQTHVLRAPLAHEIVADGEPKKTDATLYRLRLRSRTALLEQGINILYIAFGLLEWTEAAISDSRVCSPLVLLPVKLDRETALDPYTLTALDEGVTLNPALLFKLERDFDLKLSLPDEQDEDASLNCLLDHIRRLVAARKDWRVRDDTYLGLFSFAKHAMYADLAANVERFGQHEVVRALAGEDPDPDEQLVQLPSAEQLDEVDPAEIFQVVDADASQQEAIAAVKSGASIVVQGPPGTGKSQTITNIIAETLAQGKTVLFVSEKMAALKVVASRLERAGLREFCLQVHSQDVSKAAVIHDLANTLQADQTSKRFDRDHELASLALTKRELNAYARALHDNENPLRLSAFQIHGRIALLQHAPQLTFELPAIAELTQQRIAELLASIKELDHVADVLLGYEQHPWKTSLIRQFSPQLQAQLNERFGRLSIAANSLARTQEEIRSTFKLPVARSVQAANWLSGLLSTIQKRWNIPSEWLLEPRLADHLRTAERIKIQVDELASRRAKLLGRYRHEILSLPLGELASTLEQNGGVEAQCLRGSDEPGDRVLRLRAEIHAAASSLRIALRGLRVAARDLATELGLPETTYASASRRLEKIAALVLNEPGPLPSWFAADSRSAIGSLVKQAGDHQQVIDSESETLLAEFDTGILGVIDEAFVDRFSRDYRSWTRNVRPAYRRDMGQLRAMHKASSKLTYESAVDACTRAGRILESQRWLAEHAHALTQAIGSHYSGARTDWSAVQRAILVVGTIEELFPSSLPRSVFIERVCTPGATARVQPLWAALSEAVTEFDAAIAELDQVTPVADIRLGRSTVEDASLNELAAWLEQLLTGFQPLWDAADKLSGVAVDSTVADSKGLLADVREGQWVLERMESLRAAEQELRSEFGSLFAGLETDWNDVLASLSWAGSVLEHFGGPPPPEFVDALLGGVHAAPPTQSVFVAACREVDQLLTYLVPLFAPEGLDIGGVGLLDVDLESVAKWAADKRAALTLLEEWVDYQRALSEAEAAGLSTFAESLSRDRPAKELWRDAFLRQVYTLWLTWQYSTQPALAAFRRTRQEERIQEFRQLDSWQFGVASQRIAERLVLRRPRVPANLPRGSEVAILLRAASAKRRFRPLRRLFAEIPNLLPALKPCMLMSPLSVAQFLGESAMQFDVVVFDEASQILPADAIGAIGRAKQAVIVGDQQQLPPTRFFDVSGHIADDDAEEELPESVLDACLAVGLPRKPLLWHYRSRHEHLIAFSNRHFYERRLITFPSPTEQTRAVEFVRVEDGIYDRGSSKVNKAEARRIADLIVEHVSSHASESLGVITFSEAQMVAIQTELDMRKRVTPELEVLLKEERAEGEGFFVKNLENVQGDERDVIFFSVGYGPDQARNLSVNFGPLNREGGERRLNVAVTRARLRVKILASFYSHELDTTRTKARGVHLLRKYLEFADQGPIALLGEITAVGGEYESSFEEAVADALSSRGLNVIPQVGVGGFRIDLGIKDPDADRYVLGIECDGATYHSSKIARDRDRLRQQVLENLGWRIHRVWSTDWLKDPKREVERVLSAYEQARNQYAAVDKSRAMTTKTEEPIEGDSPWNSTQLESGDAGPVTAVVPVQKVASAEPYERVHLPRQGYQEEFRSASRFVIGALVRQCVEVEGPVHEDRVMQTIATSYGIARVGHLVRAHLEHAIRQAEATYGVRRCGAFLWVSGMERPRVRGAAMDGFVRPINEIAPEEIGEAVLTVLRSAFSIGRSELVVEAARLLGYDRTGARVQTAIDATIGGLLTSDVLVDVGGQVRARE